MALAALHLLGHVKSTWAAAFRGLYALAVDDAGRRRRLAPDGLTRAPDETAIDAMPSPVVPPTVEVALHGRARRKFSPERPPLTAGSKNVKNGIHYGSQIRRSWASYSSRRRHQRLQQRQTRIWRFVDVRGCGRAAGDQDRIDVVVLGMLQHELGVGAHLHRLEDNDNKAVRPQERNHRLLITPTCFDPNALDLALPQPGRQAPIARGAIVDLQLIRAFVDRHVQLVLAGIDPGAHGVMLAHLLRPFLVMRTLGSFNHPGPMKSRSRSCSAAALVARERAIRRPATCSGCAPGAGHSSRNARTIPIRANTRSV